MGNHRKPAKYHHFWHLLSAMPPTKHNRDPDKSPLIRWLVRESGCTSGTALAAFESARKAMYLVRQDGAWVYSMRSGFNHWNKLKSIDRAGPIEAPASPLNSDLDQHLAFNERATRVAERIRKWPPGPKEEWLSEVMDSEDVEESEAKALLNYLCKQGACIALPNGIRQGAGWVPSNPQPAEPLSAPQPAGIEAHPCYAEALTDGQSLRGKSSHALSEAIEEWGPIWSMDQAETLEMLHVHASLGNIAIEGDRVTGIPTEEYDHS